MSTFENQGHKVRKLAHAINPSFPKEGDGFNDEGEALDSIAESINSGWGKDPLPKITKSNQFLVSKSEKAHPFVCDVPHNGQYYTKALLSTKATAEDLLSLPWDLADQGGILYLGGEDCIDLSESPGLEEIILATGIDPYSLINPFVISKVPISETENMFMIGAEGVGAIFNPTDQVITLEGMSVQPGWSQVNTTTGQITPILTDVFDLYDPIITSFADQTIYSKEEWRTMLSKLKLQNLKENIDSMKYICCYDGDFHSEEEMKGSFWLDFEEVVNIPHLYLHSLRDVTEAIVWEIISNSPIPYTTNIQVYNGFLVPSAQNAIISIASLDFESSVIKITQDHSTNAITMYYFTTTGIASYNLSNNLTDTVTKLQ